MESETRVLSGQEEQGSGGFMPWRSGTGINNTLRGNGTLEIQII